MGFFLDVINGWPLRIISFSLTHLTTLKTVLKSFGKKIWTSVAMKLNTSDFKGNSANKHIKNNHQELFKNGVKKSFGEIY